MVEKQVIIQNKVGLHARPASQFVKKANEYESDIVVQYGDRDANGKSILALLGLGIKKGAQITISAHGSDEQEALKALQKQIENSLREENML